MELRNLERIRFVTRYFNDLQGLKHLVPLGLVFLGTAGPAWLTAVSFVGALLLAFGARRYYNTFGEVEPPRVQPAAERYALSILPIGPAPRIAPGVPASQRNMLVLALIPPVLLLFSFLFWPPWIGMESGVIVDPEWGRLPAGPVIERMIFLLCGSFFIGVWWLRGRQVPQSYHLAIGLLLSVISILEPAAARLGIVLLLCGSSMVLAGLLDHWQLVRVLGRGEEE